jgi:cytochrome c2
VQVAVGAALVAEKGGADCHLHAEVAGSGRVPVGPPLTGYRNDSAILRRWMTDPAAVKPGTRMPALGLSDAEIADLIAFLNAEP